jgi:hypothetical protein
MKLRRLKLGLLIALAAFAAPHVHAQASAIPSAEPAPDSSGDAHGRKLLSEMVTALGGDAWLNRRDWIIDGSVATFYKGAPHDETPKFEEYYRAQPFAERVVFVAHYGNLAVFGLPVSDHRDLAVVWTPDGGYEVTYKGKTPVLPKEAEEFQRRRQHSLDVLVTDWLKQPGVIVSYEGSGLVGRRLADKVSVLTATNDGIELALDESSHLPLSLTFQYRDPLYKDTNTDVEQYDDYHLIQGIQTPYTVTRLHNGDMVLQRFVTKVRYNTQLDPELFDPDKLLTKKK